MEEKIYVVAEHAGGSLLNVTREVLAFADHLRKLLHLPVEMLLLGDGLSKRKEAVDGRGADAVTLIEIPGLTDYNGEVYRSALHGFLSERRPAFVCMAHSAQAMDFAPGLAVRLAAANITAVEGVTEADGGLLFARAIENGRRIAWVRSFADTAILNIQPGTCRPLNGKDFSASPVSVLFMTCQGKHTAFNGFIASRSDPGGITEARVVVGVGNGIGNGEDLDTVVRFADLFPKSAVGGSRIVCDRGLLPCSRQVGVTGATVTPRLYVACGISGAAQHLAGMSASEFIVAVNTDARAAIMNVADVCVVEDMIPFLQEVTQRCEKEKNL